MKLNHLLILSMSLAVTWGWMTAQVRETFREGRFDQARITRLKEQVRKSQLQLRLIQEDFHDLRQTVAAALPSTLKGLENKEAAYPLRQLASVSGSGSSEDLKSMLASSLHESGKKFFREKQYTKAVEKFKSVISRYSYLPQAPEAHFLLVECYLQMGAYESLASTVDAMVSLFPESELTGFALLRLGQLLETRERYAEAMDVYRTVAQTFPYRSVVNQAEWHIRQMGP